MIAYLGEYDVVSSTRSSVLGLKSPFLVLSLGCRSSVLGLRCAVFGPGACSSVPGFGLSLSIPILGLGVGVSRP